MNIPKWSELPAPTVLDCPLINTKYAAKGWDIIGTDNKSGLVKVGYGDQIFKEIRGKEITVRKKDRQDILLVEFKKNDIVVANKTRISLIDGLVVKLQERMGFLRTLPEEVELICFVCARYFPFSQIEADHLQPHSDIIQRMKAYWEKLNDEDFFEEQEKNPLFDKMFAIQKDHLVMTQFFQRGYVHSEDNLWSACRDCNALNKKTNIDPFTFLLDQKHFGRAFLRTLPKINATGILIRAGDKQKVLAQFAIDWFAGKMQTELLSRQLFADLKLKVETSFENKVTRREEIATKKLMLRLQVAAEDSDSDNDFDEKDYEQALRKARSQVKHILSDQGATSL